MALCRCPPVVHGYQARLDYPAVDNPFVRQSRSSLVKRISLEIKPRFSYTIHARSLRSTLTDLKVKLFESESDRRDERYRFVKNVSGERIDPKFSLFNEREREEESENVLRSSFLLNFS